VNSIVNRPPGFGSAEQNAGAQYVLALAGAPLLDVPFVVGLTVTIVAGWAGPARARTASALLARTALAAVVSLSCLKDLPSYARNATAPIDPSGCSARGPNANRGRIVDMRPTGMGSRVLVRRIHRELPARRERTRRKINRGSTRRPVRQL